MGGIIQGAAVLDVDHHVVDDVVAHHGWAQLHEGTASVDGEGSELLERFCAPVQVQRAVVNRCSAAVGVLRGKRQYTRAILGQRAATTEHPCEIIIVSRIHQHAVRCDRARERDCPGSSTEKLGIVAVVVLATAPAVGISVSPDGVSACCPVPSDGFRVTNSDRS